MERRLAAVLSADVAGYSRLMGLDEAATLATLRSHLDDIFYPGIGSHGGRVVKLMGDGILAEFPSVVEAVACAVEIQQGMAARNTGVPEAQRLAFRIGVNIGDVIVEGDDIYGDGVNVAARLEALAEPGGVCIRRAVRNEVRDKLPYTYDDLGPIEVKNIARPVHAFRVRFDGSAAPARPAARGQRRAGAWVAVAAAALAVAIAAGWWLLPGTGGRAGTVPSIAVLSFDSLSPDADQEYFADGLTDDLITDLSKISGLAVISRSSTIAYKGNGVRAQDVASELDVRYVLTGSVRRAAGTVRINAQLVDGETGRQIWAERYERDQSNLFALQDAVIAEIVSALAVRLTEGEQERLVRVPTTNLEAYDAYLRAEASGIHTVDPVAFQATLSNYRRAIDLDPDFAEAHAGYARANAEIWRLSYGQIISLPVARKRAYDAASKALTLDPQNARAYSVLSLMQLVDKRHDEAIASARTAVSLAPSDSEAHAQLAHVLAYAGQIAASLDALATARRLAPRPTRNLRVLAGIVYFIASDDAAAIEMLGQAPEHGLQSEPELVFLAAAHASSGHIERAGEVREKLLRYFPIANLNYFTLTYDFYRGPADRDRLINALAAAGVPGWPYGFAGRPEDRLSGAELRALAIGHTWAGKHQNGVGFIQYIDQRGRFVYRSANSFGTGSGYVEGDRLCIDSDALLAGKTVCGAVYRRPGGGSPAYAHVTAQSLTYFDVTQ